MRLPVSLSRVLSSGAVIARFSAPSNGSIAWTEYLAIVGIACLDNGDARFAHKATKLVRRRTGRGVRGDIAAVMSFPRVHIAPESDRSSERGRRKKAFSSEKLSCVLIAQVVCLLRIASRRHLEQHDLAQGLERDGFGAEVKIGLGVAQASNRMRPRKFLPASRSA